MKVLYVCTELFPLLKTGGLGDVGAALPPALRDAGCDVRVLLPGFPGIRAGVGRSRLPHASPLALPDGDGPRLATLGLTQPPSLRPATLPASGLAAYVLDVRALFDRPGNPYQDAHGDNGIRFALLGWAAACLGLGLDPSWQPDVVHCHDWHTGLAPLYLRQMAPSGPPPAATVFTVHNLAYQGTFARSLFGQLGLPDALFGIDGIEFWGQVSFMKAGLQFADRITTVSPTYAREILDAEQGCGLDGVLRARSGVVSGILNGVDYALWNPAHDAVLAHPYDWDHLEGKGLAKAQLQRKTGLQVRPEAMVFGVVSRLTEQKGLNLVEAVSNEVVDMGGQLAILGAGDAPLERAFLRAAERYAGRVAVHIGYDESLAHHIMAGADAIVVPSRFEPCGLTQLYGLRYGALPLVHRVGGLADTVVDATARNLEDGRATGFAFEEFSAQGLRAAMRRAFDLHARPGAWARVQRTAMRQRFDWREAAAQYISLYRSLKPPRGAAGEPNGAAHPS
ncbi:MAG TPA: glycogen synthase GlgA [Ramlibacter sp.]|nr:glycogen synthase GlgA [Ramlibacter sp.]